MKVSQNPRHWIDTQQENLEAELKSWVLQNSGSDNLHGLSAMADVLLSKFTPISDTQERLALPPVTKVSSTGELVETPSGDLLRFTKRPEAPLQVLLLIHYDTVFPANHPFQTWQMTDDRVMNGPGAADAKGGILTLFTALAAFEAFGETRQLGWQVVLNPDEETGSHASGPYLAEAARRADIGMVYEPALPDGTLAGARKGSGNFSLRVFGQASHAGRAFHEGRSAIIAASRAALMLHDLNGTMGETTVNVSRIDGGGPTNVVADRAVIRFNIRIPGQEAQDACDAALEEIVQALNGLHGISAELHGGFYRKPKPMEGRTAELFAWAKQVGKGLGLDLAWKPTGGCCDGNNLAAAGLPTIDTLGVRGGLIHSAEEFIYLDSLSERAKLSFELLNHAATSGLPWKPRP